MRVGMKSGSKGLNQLGRMRSILTLPGEAESARSWTMNEQNALLLLRRL